MADEPWIELVETSTKSFSNRLVSRGDVIAVLNRIEESADCPYLAIEAHIERSKPFSPLSFGRRSEGEPAEVRTISELDSFGSWCRICLWGKSESTISEPQIVARSFETLEALVRAYWKADLRNAKSWLVSHQNSEREALVEKTITFLDPSDRIVALIYCDLDNFKAANDKLGHLKGDQIILEYAALLDAAIPTDGIALHRGGDEFEVLCPVRGPTAALELAHTFMKAVALHDFETGDIRIGSKVGIALSAPGSEPATYQELESSAEAATSAPSGDKFRGLARIAGHPTSDLPAATDVFALDLAFCITKTNLGTSEPFMSPWLNLVAHHAYQAAMGEMPDPDVIRSRVSDILSWIQPEKQERLLVSAAYDPSRRLASAKFSDFDVCFALANGLLRAYTTATEEHSLLIRYSTDLTVGAFLVDGATTLYSWGDNDSADNKYDLGMSIKHSSSGACLGKPISRAVLIKVGHAGLTVPPYLFAEIIIVDDRPTRGGGLPDFWEATIARLVDCVTEDPNVTDVFFLGEKSHAAQTASKLGEIASWHEDLINLSYKTGMPEQKIRAVAARLVGRVHFPDSRDTLITQLAVVLRGSHTIVALGSAVVPEAPRFLQRDLNASAFGLTSTDGCRVGTIAEAYPIVLELARKAKGAFAIRDQAGQELLELIDFKVSLKTPFQNMIPAFYMKDKELLEAYFNRVFIAETGLFGGVFRDSGQLEAVLGHIAAAVTSRNQRFNTRRAILVVPHVVVPGQDLSPLGLVSVRTIPRFMSARIVLHFSFTWRTVEALVGFPYSIYGSVRYAHHLVELLRAQLAPEAARALTAGEISYIAHSLQFFSTATVKILRDE